MAIREMELDEALTGRLWEASEARAARYAAG
jgi:hypothetical protein